MPQSAPKTLIVLTAREQREFLPDTQFERLLALLPRHQIVDPLKLSAGEWPALLQEVRPEIIVSGWKTPPLPHDYPVGNMNGLKYWCHLPGSVKKFVTEEHLAHGLRVSNWGNSISRVVAECGLFLTISALRRANTWAFAMHAEGGWKNDDTEFFSLFDRRVGLHGFGAIARELARLMQPFNVRIETFSPSVPDTTLDECGVKRAASLAALFANNDVIIELAPLTPKNQGSVTGALLRSIPAGGVFVNIGRGAVVDEAALVLVAQEGKIQIALDVFATEPLPVDSPLRGLRNVTLLPHLSGPTTDRRRDAGQFALANLERYLAGEPLAAEITTEIYTRST